MNQNYICLYYYLQNQVISHRHMHRPAGRYFFFVSATQSATSATFKLRAKSER